MQEETRHLPLRSSTDREPDQTFHCFPGLPLEIRSMIWNHAMIFWSEPQVFSVKMEPEEPGVPIPTGRIPVQCPLLQVNQETRADALNVVRPYIYNNYNFPVVYINLKLDTILFDDDKSLFQFCKIWNRPGWQKVVVPHIALFYATWKVLYNPLILYGDVDKVEDTDMDIDTVLNCLECIWHLGVRDVTIIVTGEDICHRSAVIFEIPKESPLETGVSINELFKDWKALEQEVKENLESYHDNGIEDAVKHREGIS